MGLSRQARIITLLVIDTVFFFVELIAGYAVGSLALVADSFHMLNDVLSLVVALYTIKLATSPSSAANSYGWQRAEILGALINGVFLVALCVSIFLEAIGRIVSPPEITNPKVIVVVGSLGLLSNVVGLFLFHEHGHSHGHSHGPPQLPEGDGSAIPDIDEAGGRPRSDSMSSLYQHPAQTRAQVIETAQEFGYGRTQSEDTGFMGAMSPPTHHRASSQSRRGRGSSIPRPKSKRNSSAAKPGGNETLPLPQTDLSASSVASASTTVADSPPDEALENGDHDHDHEGHKHVHMAKDASEAEQGIAHDHDHEGHDHSHDEGKGDGHGHGGHGHSHGSMNMRGVFLHVMGDALGNVGVIAAGLVIWFCHGRWTLYFDPGVSLAITCIIFSSALPLVKSASYILLQGVPSHVSLDAVKSSIHGVPGVVSVHELHVWQLSESTIVASVHVLISPGWDYMDAASGIREAMHQHGIHSVTIQPEFYADQDDQSETACLIRCPPELCGTDTCCPPPKTGNLIDVDDQNGHESHEGHEGHEH
ncbi:cation efflux protein [Naematelia encephala]|uniref:Cation efflux protein n=1 Tax=Naematelia encephala TaxID=71784 RepID=A0A1Y2B381_9TREE|nr:cation efflux protein [Naematelia encephala]